MQIAGVAVSGRRRAGSAGPDRAFGTGAFFSACGVYFVRFLRLGIVAAFVYWVFFARPRWLFDALYPRLTDELTVERTAFLIRLALYVAFTVPLFCVNILFDYAKIRAVVEDRRSMLGALAAELAIHRRHPRGVGALHDERVRLLCWWSAFTT